MLTGLVLISNLFLYALFSTHMSLPGLLLLMDPKYPGVLPPFFLQSHLLDPCAIPLPLSFLLDITLYNNLVK